MKRIIVWPDGQEQPAPSDGYVYIVGQGDVFAWDENMSGWVDGLGDLCHFENQYQPGIGRITVRKPGGISSTFGFTSNTEEYSTLVKPPNICECGAHAVGSKRHSSWCRLYKEFYD